MGKSSQLKHKVLSVRIKARQGGTACKANTAEVETGGSLELMGQLLLQNW